MSKPKTPLVKLTNCSIRPQSENQAKYLETIDQNFITFGIGPAGTGKTYLAVAKAIEALISGEYNKIILSRPAVEAGEKIGFLPGTLQEKMEPFMAPLFDALNVNWQDGAIESMLDKKLIEVVPVAYMRGRTFLHSFIIVDEAQNLSREQMKMVLTRFGEGSKMVVTGDPTQCDLPKNVESGLRLAEQICNHGTEGVSMVKLDAVEDVRRHMVVANILKTMKELGYD